MKDFNHRMPAGLLFGFAVLITVTRPIAAQTLPRVNVREIDNFIADTVARNRVPGFSIVIVQDDQMILCKGYGQAASGRAMTAQTPLYVGSVAKVFTATAVMQLVEQGRIELDAPVGRYIPWFRVASGETAHQITVRHLLNHTSGLRQTDDPGGSNLSPSMEEQVRRMRDTPVVAPPGTKFQYDSQNYRTLGLLIERVSGQSYGDYVRDHIFAPLQMTHSRAGSGEAEGLAQGYSQMFGFAFPRTEKFQPAAQASGYVISSAEDMGQYLIAVLNHGRHGGQILLKDATLAQMMTPPQGIDSPYGFGWMVSAAGIVTKSNLSDRIVFHGGSLPNFHSFVFLLPEKGLGFAFLCNQNGLIPILTWSQKLRTGLIWRLLGQATPAQASYVWIGWLLGALFLLTLALQVRGILRLPRWLKRVSRHSRPVRWLRILLDFVLPVAVFVGLGWRAPYALQPDLTVWLFVASALFAIRGISKVVLVTGSRHPVPLRVQPAPPQRR